MRVTVAILAVVTAAMLGRFVWDDIVFAADIPRGVTVDGVQIGNRERDAAADRLINNVSADREVELLWEGTSVTHSLADWGVVIDTDQTLDAAEAKRGGGPLRLMRWIAAVVRDRSVEPVWTVELTTLATSFGPDAIDLAFVASEIELAPNGEFVAIEHPPLLIVDIDKLEAALLEAANDETVSTIEVPTGGFHEVELAHDLAAAANELTSHGLRVVRAGQLATRSIDVATLRAWLVVDGVDDPDDFTFDPDDVIETLRGYYPDVETESDGSVEFVIGFDGEVYIVGALAGSGCCAADTAERLMDTLRNGPADEVVPIFPDEPPDAEGLAWAESLGITELVGEFTTNYKPNQTRNVNIARIAEITRGAIIEPGETFSVNDYVGRRTEEDGFVSAGVIANGVFSSSVGGGISQYATTMFNAAFFAGLDFGQYQSHSIYISRYPYGREATVSFPAPDLQIVNTTPYGILIWPTTNEDSITVRLYSTLWVSGEQTCQTEKAEGTSCTRVTTQRTRTWVEDGRTEIDTVTARYRPEGIRCDGTASVPTSSTTTSTTVPTSVP